MNVLSKFENKLEELVSGLFARTFRSAVQPVELAAALNRELDNTSQALSRDRQLVPNHFIIELSQGDFEKLSALGPQLPRELVDLVREHANEQRYSFTGPVSVELVEADDLTTGRYRVLSSTEAGVTSAAGEASDTTIRRATALLSVNGDDLPLLPPGIVIGRGNSADLRIDDPGVSRKHVHIEVRDDGQGPLVSAIDLGSTNGMLIDGQRVERAPLRDGTTIRIGNTTMSVRIKEA